MHTEDYAVARCLSVCLSVTRRYSVNTAEHILKKFYTNGVTILVFPHQTGWQYSDGDPPNGGIECKGVCKSHEFRLISRFILEMI